MFSMNLEFCDMLNLDIFRFYQISSKNKNLNSVSTTCCKNSPIITQYVYIRRGKLAQSCVRKTYARNVK